MRNLLKSKIQNELIRKKTKIFFILSIEEYFSLFDSEMYNKTAFQLNSKPKWMWDNWFLFMYFSLTNKTNVS